MRWYFAINEAGASGGSGRHAKLAVLSAIRAGGLSPYLLYFGERGEFTEWMEDHDVVVIDTSFTFLPAFEAAVRAGRHPEGFSGHWLRTAVCLLEQSDEFVLYTDIDVIFRRTPQLAEIRPPFIACAPEFRPDRWDYFNSGVMVMNVPALRRDYPAFENYVSDTLGSPEAVQFNDQLAYNEFYRGRWTRADPVLNWKPYWGFDERAVITHYHGPKLEHMRWILDGALPWDEENPRLLGSLFVSALPSYVAHLRDLLAILDGFEVEDRDEIERILEDTEALYRVIPLDRIDFSFMQPGP
jgi:hypothetical protein